MKVTEEILLTLGVDYKNVVSGLQRAGSYIAGWGTSLAHTVKSQFFHALAAERVFEYLIQGAEAVSERIVAIKRVSEELGASTNMVQGLFIAAEKKGLDKEAIVRPLIRLSALLGEAKDGSVKARQELVQYGIATKETNWQTMRFADALSSLQQRFKTLNTEQQNSMLKQLIGVKGASSVRSILEGSDVRKMDEGSVFKISPENLRFYQELFAAQKEN
jgi:hypothetical protein